MYIIARKVLILAGGKDLCESRATVLLQTTSVPGEVTWEVLGPGDFYIVQNQDSRMFCFSEKWDGSLAVVHASEKFVEMYRHDARLQVVDVVMRSVGTQTDDKLEAVKCDEESTKNFSADQWNQWRNDVYDFGRF